MDYGGRSGYAIEIIPDASTACPEPTIPPLNDHSIWAVEDDYRAWGGETSLDVTPNQANDTRLSQSESQSRAGSEQPQSKKARGSLLVDSGPNKSKAIGRMFFKTKLCCKFRAGTCPYVTNCNFAHGMEELRKPPPNWQEIVAAHEEGSPSESREEHQIPIITSSDIATDGQRSYKGRHCKKFYTEEGCPYGDMCTFLHDEQSKARESVAISLSPTVGGGGFGNGVGSSNQKPSNWKTRICNKWEMTGYCPFGTKCHFAHGAAELHKYGGKLVEVDARDALSAASDSRQAGATTKTTDAAVASNNLAPHADVFHVGVPSQRSTIVNQRQVQRPVQKWKGPDRISRIYGDWIDDIE
ncbi:Zinc finger CCCH domain-containing protein 56 [Apostasia shenzhenica]|uniref:Zinc finger CCCH domain-containing protein 56 n=1 Tax=Apostasia shenzhenica TaxID=1088818 RepID=A0A2I0AFN9_9ASPA|nr:Zinc finger CCCH domain-containing protein 56 [Apostasia shenzhenica]